MHPLPVSLPKECRKAEKILRSFMEPSRNGLDGVIPRQVLAQARGFVIFTVIKAGFLFSARAGSGIVIARLSDGSWSAPSAIGTAGMGFGGQAGAEMTEFLIILNSRSALRSFMSAGSLTIGGNMSVAVGPLGRNGEVSGSLNTKGKVAAMYSYSKTKGLFGGLSIEGSVILERQDANCIAYERDSVNAKMLLSGEIPPPSWAGGLIDALEKSTDGVKGWIKDEPLSRGSVDGSYAFGGIPSPAIGENGIPSPSRSPGIFGGAEAVKKSLSNPFGSGSKSKLRPNAVDSYFPSSRKGSKSRDQSKGLAGAVDDSSENDTVPKQTASDSPFSHAHESDHGASGDDHIFTHVRASSTNSMPSTRFSTHFESDFDPSQAASPTHHRQPPSISTKVLTNAGFSGPLVSFDEPEKQDEEDPFDVFNKPPSSNLHGQYSPRTSLNGTHHQLYEAPPALTSSGSSATTSSLRSSPVSAVFNHQRSTSTSSQPLRKLSVKRGLRDSAVDGRERAIALFDFQGQQEGDLPFNKGDVIVIVQKSDSIDDWWTGKIDSREGMFPANYVEVV